MLKNHHFILDQSGMTLELESFENEGIVLDLYFGGGKSITFNIYDCLTEKFSDHYRTICATLEPFIIEQLETNVRLCFTKWWLPPSTEYYEALAKNQREFTRLSDLESIHLSGFIRLKK